MNETAIDTRTSATTGAAQRCDTGPSIARRAVVSTFKATAAAQARTLAPLADDLVLVDSGLDSLCFAIIVAQLEDELGLDPFSDLDDAFFPVCFAEFVQLYEAAAERQAG